ncbi:MAG: hypothetical protein NDJ90_08560 [Oligoflexia bacterium]|nr:hypothetical protein [Oligoflexia bacterium]
MQKKGQLLRLKKGFYVLSKEFAGREHSPQIVANLLYGPSYVSLESALSDYQLIPEKVVALTSVTSQKNKSFDTPIGLFTYRHLASSLYPLGVTLRKGRDGRPFLIATAEKALMDVFTLKFENAAAPRAADIEPSLREDLRLDLNELAKRIDRKLLVELEPHYRYRVWNRLLIKYLLNNL